MARRKLIPESGGYDTLISRIKDFIQSHPPPALAADAMLSVDDFRQLGYTPRALFPTVTEDDVSNAEAALGFQLPPLLRRLYKEVSNGIAGFGYDIFGLEGGCDCHCGTLVDTYTEFDKGGESETKPWQIGLLPFCHWGCNIFSCVDCVEAANHVFTYEDGGVWPQRYALPDFFEMWLEGKVCFSDENVETVTTEIINPFTKQKSTVSARSRKKPST